jgi:hypothetical protein
MSDECTRCTFALIAVVLIAAVVTVAILRKGTAAGGAAHWPAAIVCLGARFTL